MASAKTEAEAGAQFAIFDLSVLKKQCLIFFYENKSVILLSSRALDIPANLKDTVEHSSESPEELYKRLTKKGLNRSYIDGGITIRRFLAAKLINDPTIMLI